MSYQDPAQSLNINVRAGEQRLGGADMLRVLRFAGYENGEEGRMETTRNFITTMLSNMKNITSLENATELYRTMLAYIYTNMDAAAFASIADLVYCYVGLPVFHRPIPVPRSRTKENDILSQRSYRQPSSSVPIAENLSFFPFVSILHKNTSAADPFPALFRCSSVIPQRLIEIFTGAT